MYGRGQRSRRSSWSLVAGNYDSNFRHHAPSGSPISFISFIRHGHGRCGRVAALALEGAAAAAAGAAEAQDREGHPRGAAHGGAGRGDGGRAVHARVQLSGVRRTLRTEFKFKRTKFCF